MTCYIYMEKHKITPDSHRKQWRPEKSEMTSLKWCKKQNYQTRILYTIKKSVKNEDKMKML